MNNIVYVCTVFDGHQTWASHVFANKSDAETWKSRNEYEDSHRMFPDQYQIEEFEVE